MKERRLVIKADQKEFESAILFLGKGLKEMHVPDQMIQESELVFEEPFLRIIEQYQDKSMEITVSLVRNVAEVKVLIEFYGERFDIDFGSMDLENPGVAILSKHEDRIGFTYRKGHNFIGVLAKRTHDRMGLLCALAMALAILFYAAITMTVGEESLASVYENLIYPLEMMFGNAMIMIMAPVTFFSLVTNITNCYVISDNTMNLRRLSINVLGSAVFANLLAIAYYIWMKQYSYGNPFENYVEYDKTNEAFSDRFFETINSIVPTDIFQPFMDISPFPMVLIGILTAALVCSMNKHFDVIKKMNDSINALVDKVLSVIMMFLPVATFMSFFDVMCHWGFFGLYMIFAIVYVLSIGLLIMLAFSVLRLAVLRINPISFFRKSWRAFVENFKMNSSIDAVPYNTRFCAKAFGISMRKLDMEIPILAQLNQTGNGFVLMMTTLMLLSFSDVNVDVFTMIIMAILIIILSLGAPGQSGSLLVGLIVMFSFVGISFELISVIIFVEVLFGRALPVLNVLFDIMTVVASDKQEKRRKRSNER